MKIHLNKFSFFLLLLLAVNFNVSAQLFFPNYNACPNQVVNVAGVWNNVSNINYSVYVPPVGPPGAVAFVGAGVPNFTISQPNPTAGPPGQHTYTVIASGTSANGPVSNTVSFVLTVTPPALLTLTVDPYHCHGAPITIIAPPGGASYNFLTNCGLFTSNLNTHQIPGPGVSSSCNGSITVNTTIGGCARTGSINIAVAPLLGLSISNPTSVCKGACLTLSANLAGGTNYQWEFGAGNPVGQFNVTTLPLGGWPACNPGVTVNDAGVYTVKADQVFPAGNPAAILCPYSANTQLTVVDTKPVVLSASPSNVVCQGTNLSLSASAGNGVSSWSWLGPGLTSNIANPLISPALPVNTGDYTATATFQGAFIACTTSAVIHADVIPVGVPVINAPTSVCQGLGFDISANSIPPANHFTWTGPLFAGSTNTLSFPTTSLNFQNVQVNASGTQFVTGYYTSGTHTLQCPVTSSVQLNVIPVNTISVIPPPPVCRFQSVFLQALATSANQYVWSGPAGYANLGPNVWVMNPDLNSTGIYTVTAYFGNGALVCPKTNTVQVTVNPVLGFNLEPFNRICYNSPITITGPSGATSYTWTSSTGITTNSKDLTFASAQPKHTGSYTLTVALGSCYSSSESQLEVLSPISFSLTSLDRTICAGDTIFLEAGAVGGSQNYAYVWNPAIYLESSNGPKQMGIPLGTVDYNVMVHDIACPNYTIAHSVSINVKQPPMPKLDFATTGGCAPFNLVIDTKTFQDAYVTNIDLFNDPKKIYQITRPDTIALPAGKYNLKIYSVGKNGCSGLYEYPNEIESYPRPGTEVHWEPETPTTFDELVFYPTHASNSPITAYSWNFMGGITPGDTSASNVAGASYTTTIKSPVRKYEQFGTYPVILISQNEYGCIDTTTKFVKVIDEMQLYVPNTFTPNDDGVNDVFMAKGTGIKTEGYTMDIFNRAGINVFSTKDINQGWDGKVGGQYVKDATYVYKIRYVGMNGEGRKEVTGYVSIIK